ncbi:MAG: prolyl oligopeptidase family serine peptidase [Sphingobacteriaceae bacterium]|nr:prolyl oligopeptidase family serine peptidase [Sphingobacteriaceae bacterium]
MGVAPTNFKWAADSKTLYFNWNPEGKEKVEFYKVNINNSKIEKTTEEFVENTVEPNYVYNNSKSLGLFTKNGDIYLHNFKKNATNKLTQTIERETNPKFLNSGNVVYQRGENIFQLNLQTNELSQLTNFVKGKASQAKDKPTLSLQDSWLKKDQEDLFDIIKKKNKIEAENIAKRKKETEKNTSDFKPIFTEDKSLNSIVVSPDGRYISYKLNTEIKNNHNTIMPVFVTSSGYVENEDTRAKVGEKEALSESYIYDKLRDTVYAIATNKIPGIKDLPDYLKDYPVQLEEKKKKNEDRAVNLSNPIWNENGSNAVIVATAHDNKDLWILKLNASNGSLDIIDRQRDEAWIGGPGIGARNINWIDKQHFYYQSEATGYSHLYVANIENGTKKQLTSGKWEVQSVKLSKDKSNFYLSGNKEHPGITHFYKLSVNGGNLIQITNMKGGNEVTLSPDEQYLAINHSTMNKPWELYIQANKAGEKAIQITKSTSTEFDSYAWRQPDMVSFKNRFGDDVYARVYPASKPHANKPAVVFVHGAGYLQNVHFWWSQYFREYMFNNLLADNGYTVIDIDYTASSGYGRNHRTGIYRHMGGKDLSDQVDGIKMLTEKYDINPKNVGLYGGSYGGFITLMALFNESEVFRAGAALRSVTDWAHYNHGYTSNILNEPYNDEIAYKRSSPIYFADKLKGDLLMAHGMVDDNVMFQDIVRISQKFIELKKNNWELAVYPVEAHGFVEPSSWTDEYKRIFNLFERTLKNN